MLVLPDETGQETESIFMTSCCGGNLFGAIPHHDGKRSTETMHLCSGPAPIISHIISVVIKDVV